MTQVCFWEINNEVDTFIVSFNTETVYKDDTAKTSFDERKTIPLAVKSLRFLLLRALF